MNINLSWDLFILVFFGVVTAYTFIIGRNQALKVIASTYIAILCADGLGNIFARYFASSEAFLKLMKLFSIGNSDQATAFFKVLVLIILVVLIAVRGLFQFDLGNNRMTSVKVGLLMLVGVMSAGLMMSAMLIFVSGGSLVTSIASSQGIMSDIYAQSRLVRLMLDFSNVWFFMPGIGLLTLSILDKKSA